MTEYWTIPREIEAAEMWFLTRILRISWTERITNEKVLRRAGVKRSHLRTIRRRQ